MKRIFTTLLFTSMVIFAFAQGTITGMIVDAESGEGLIGATVMDKASNTGTVTDLDGSFKLEGLEAGKHMLEITFVGFVTQEMEIAVESGDTDLGTLKMESDAIGLSEINVVAQIAVDRKTPVAVSTISAKTIETKLGNQEFTEVMKFSPSITATKNSSTGGNSGGFGDGSITVRGFAQENVALLINGIPVNGMEDNRVYWSNWAGLGDVTRTIQIQRGLAASSLSVASIGGTINIVTKTTDQEKGGAVSMGIGNDGYQKLGLTLSTGKMDNGWAVTFTGSRTTGDGYIENGYIDAWNYFGSIAKEINNDHLVTFTIVGSPQRHGQRDFAPNLATQRDIYGTKWNDDSGTYQGESFLFRENFYHKPQMGLSHYWTINDKMTWSNSLYASVGRGGGTGDIGGLVRSSDGAYREREFRQAKDVYGHQQFDAIANYNQGKTNALYDTSLVALNYEMANGDDGTGQIAVNGVNGLIKRASMNEHQWFGWLSKLNYEISNSLTLSGGLDMRWYHGSHYRKTIDLLGADYWFEQDNINNMNDWVDINHDGIRDANEMGALIRPTNDAGKLFGSVDDNEKIDYHNDEDINWYGGFARLEYSEGDLSAFVSGSLNYTNMRRIDYFEKRPGQQETDWSNFLGYTGKLGANYNINSNHNVYANFGYIARAPYFDALYPTFSNDELNDNAVNEKILAAELGYGFRNRKLKLNVNGYFTSWKDKTQVDDFPGMNGETFYINLLGVDALHMGVEVDLTANITRNLNVTAFASIGDWQWKNNPSGSVSDENNNVIETVDLYLDGLKVGNSAQTSYGIGLEYAIAKQLSFDWQTLFYDNYYASFDPEDRDDEVLVGVQPLKLPFYSLTDIGLTWNFKFIGQKAYLRANVNNLFNEQYVTFANDNVREEDKTINDDRDSEAYKERLDGASGWWGFGRTWNMSFKMNF